ncbi:MAG: formylglycine-generating enzyme family protein, partial [Alphaproteobacteria bacterium]|nr:formylglycine-generating enzyme family protein [Alphaproteobacteria bacterium]
MTPMPIRLALAIVGALLVSTAGLATPPQPGERFSDCAACPEMLVLPAGAFAMGSQADEAGHRETEAPQHTVEIRRPIAIGLYEVNAGEWQACVADGACVAARGETTGAAPVTGISWNDAKDYVAWLSKQSGATYRLPSEAEWEYAARAGTVTPWFWGDTADISCPFANIAGDTCDGHDGPAPTG